MQTDALPAEVPGETRRIDVGDVELHAVVAGPETGDLAVLLHGFPEFWYGWREQIRPLAQAGFRVVVPDQRGYNRSDKPDGADAYHVDELVGDICGLIDAAGRDSADLVGHDWGGAVAWWTALDRPERVDRLVVANAPHPTAMYRELSRSWEQRLRSLYMVGFWLPGFDRVAALGNWAPVVRGMRRSSNPGAFTDADFERYRSAWSRPGAFEAGLNWYRSIARDRPRPDRERLSLPTRIVWGTGDEFLGLPTARESLELCDDGALCTIDEATHWINHEFPVRVADEVIDHLRGPTSA